MVRWSSEVQVTVRLWSNLKSILSLTLMDVKLVINIFTLSDLILPNCGPDVKYFLAFMRTQLSTTTTMFLVFGPKVT